MLADLRRAIELITLVPVRGSWPSSGRVRVAGWFPLVGLGIGSVGWAGAHALEQAGWYGEASLVIASVIVAFSAWITRMLHYDGLGDVADAWWGASTVPRRLDIMADSALGAFGATAIALAVVAQVSAISEIISGFHQSPLLIIPALARFAPAFAAWLGTPARPGGLGRSVMGPPGVAESVATFVVMVLCLAAGWFGFGVWGLAFVVVAIAISLVVPHVIAHRMGGVTGDVMGASVIVVETLLYLLAATGLELLR
jgi:adenosylcobinamide-GDP ribazoletransferase